MRGHGPLRTSSGQSRDMPEKWSTVCRKKMSAKTEAVRSTRAGSVSAYMEMHQKVPLLTTQDECFPPQGGWQAHRFDFWAWALKWLLPN